MNQRERKRQRWKKTASEQFAAGISQARPSTELHINELVLSGLDFTAREQIAGDVQTELANTLSEHGLPQIARAACTRERIDGGTISIHHGKPAEQIGSQIARAIYDGLNAGNSTGGHMPKKI
jgi:hypothetical protein